MTKASTREFKLLHSYTQGLAAFDEGKTVWDNPYPYRDDQAISVAWVNGFREGRKGSAQLGNKMQQTIRLTETQLAELEAARLASKGGKRTYVNTVMVRQKGSHDVVLHLLVTGCTYSEEATIAIFENGEEI